ncbi:MULTISPECIES: MotA/TolQ/ExbB proton channel family protein [Undibacterium]|jgi:biopolymer transport protein ExbB/TolQ|nr:MULTISPECIES: MotA/TolQ/ExbB proton channel family protein [Undibacterium]
MPTSTLELLMYQIGQLFLFPVLVLVAAMFAYSFYALGSFILQALQRRRRSQHLAGFPLLQHVRKNAETTSDELDLLAHKLLEPARIASRIAPMLGLIGTMIPMGPALKSLTDGNLAKVSGNLTVAFSVVIIALIAASITYWIANVQRRWLAEEIVEIQKEKTA